MPVLKVQGAVANPAVKRMQSRGQNKNLYGVSGVLGVKELISVAMALTLCSAASADLSGTALIVDGDTITISGNKIRLNGIDTPEKN